ncbi:uncharacterized protein LOC135210851 isoform X2 [Macrobrachium nipponense]|uniref:uncharacterized protein LOC135210851 isoform X2 n=1 Tax=Macrobrachium nipponense TaxID=159736 RepID=UPI0030C864B1
MCVVGIPGRRGNVHGSFDLGLATLDFRGQLLNAAEEMRQATRNLTEYHALIFDPKELEDCYKEGNRVSLDITKLEIEVATPMLDEDSHQNDMSALQREKDNVEEEVTSLQAEIRELMKSVSAQQASIDALAEEIVKLEGKSLQAATTMQPPVESICSPSALTA